MKTKGEPQWKGGEQCKSEQKSWPLRVSFFCIMGVTESQNIRKSGLKGNVSLNKGISSIVTETSNEENPTLFQKICSQSSPFYKWVFPVVWRKSLTLYFKLMTFCFICVGHGNLFIAFLSAAAFSYRNTELVSHFSLLPTYNLSFFYLPSDIVSCFSLNYVFSEAWVPTMFWLMCAQY